MVDIDSQLQDHATGLEMEIVELARQADQAALEGWPDQEAELRRQLEKLYSELAMVAERLTAEASSTTQAQVRAEPAGEQAGAQA